MSPTLKRRLLYVVGGLAMVFVVIQLLPFGRPEPNPPIRREPRWDTPRTRELAVRACFDCHSNEARYPWYSYVAPTSWLVTKDVREARENMNFSEWDLPQREGRKAPEEVQNGNMPLPLYLPLHPEAKLTEQERQELIQGLRATFRQDVPRAR